METQPRSSRRSTVKSSQADDAKASKNDPARAPLAAHQQPLAGTPRVPGTKPLKAAPIMDTNAEKPARPVKAAAKSAAGKAAAPAATKAKAAAASKAAKPQSPAKTAAKPASKAAAKTASKAAAESNAAKPTAKAGAGDAPTRTRRAAAKPAPQPASLATLQPDPQDTPPSALIGDAHTDDAALPHSLTAQPAGNAPDYASPAATEYAAKPDPALSETPLNEAPRVSPLHRHELVQREAYFIAEERGFPRDCEVEHWLEAERRVAMRLARSS